MVVLQGDMSKPQNLEKKKKKELHSQTEEWLQAENDVFFSRLKHLLFQVLGGLKFRAVFFFRGHYIANPNNALVFSVHPSIITHRGVSKNRDTPKWMVYNGKPY